MSVPVHVFSLILYPSLTQLNVSEAKNLMLDRFKETVSKDEFGIITKSTLEGTINTPMFHMISNNMRRQFMTVNVMGVNYENFFGSRTNSKILL